MCPGCKNLGASMLVGCGDAVPPCDCTGAVLIGIFRIMTTGVDTVCADGNPTVFHSGITSSTPMASASSPNEVRVVQLRRERWAQEASSRLSQKILSPRIRGSIPCATMVSSEREICLQVWTPRHSPRALPPQIKKAAFSRDRLELFRHRRCPTINDYFGASVLGAAGLGAVPVGLGAAGLVPVPAAGAGTPDCVL